MIDHMCGLISNVMPIVSVGAIACKNMFSNKLCKEHGFNQKWNFHPVLNHGVAILPIFKLLAKGNRGFLDREYSLSL
jgi:hypothetical protein